MTLSIENKVNKLAAKFKRPPKKEFLDEVVKELSGFDERAVTDALRLVWKRNKHFPSLAEIMQLVAAESMKYKKKSAPIQNTRNCAECENQGWFMVINPGRGYTTIASCSCPRGIDVRATKGYPRFDDCAAKGYTKKYKEWRDEKRK